MKRLVPVLLTAWIALSLAGCGRGTPTGALPTPLAEYGDAQPVVDQALSDLEQRLGVKAQDVTVEQVKETDFPDTSLGVPEPGKAYAQVITPGYIVRLTAAGKTYEYHGSGSRVVLAPEAQSPVQETATPSPTSTPAAAEATPTVALSTTPPQVPPAPGNVDTFHPVEIAEAGLTVEVPSGWLRLEPDWVWKPDVESRTLLGVKWADLQPPMQAEAAMLPAPSQILQAEAIDLAWGQARSFTLEVYGEATPGGGKAPVTAVETHILIVVDRDGARRAYDLYASGSTADELAALQPALKHMLDSAAPKG
jgi:hypothetical protein